MKVGDVVKLRSGGAQMTVENLTPTSVRCTWFAYGDGWMGSSGPNLRHVEFPPAMLDVVSEAPTTEAVS